MQDTSFLQQLVCATFHIFVIILRSLRRQQPRQLHSPWFDSRLSTSWTRVEGRERTSASSCNLRSCPLTHFWLVHFPSLLKGTQPERGSPLLCSKLAGEFIKVAGQALEHQNKVSCPSWFTLKTVSYIHRASCWWSCNKVPQFAGGLFFFLFSRKTSVTKLESQLK